MSNGDGGFGLAFLALEWCQQLRW